MRRIKEPPLFSGDSPSEAARLLLMAKASDAALADAASALDEALDLLRSSNTTAAAAFMGMAHQAVRDGLFRSGSLQRVLHEQFGEEESPP